MDFWRSGTTQLHSENTKSGALTTPNAQRDLSGERAPYPGCAVSTSHVREYVSLWNSRRRHSGGKSEACSGGYHKRDRRTTWPEIQRRALKTSTWYDRSSQRETFEQGDPSTRGTAMGGKESREFPLSLTIPNDLSFNLILSIDPKGTEFI